MTIFEVWLLEFNEKMKKENRHVLLLIDNAGGHNISLELRNKLTNVVTRTHFFVLPRGPTYRDFSVIDISRFGLNGGMVYECSISLRIKLLLKTYFDRYISIDYGIRPISDKK